MYGELKSCIGQSNVFNHDNIDWPESAWHSDFHFCRSSYYIHDNKNDIVTLDTTMTLLFSVEFNNSSHQHTNLRILITDRFKKVPQTKIAHCVYKRRDTTLYKSQNSYNTIIILIQTSKNCL